LVAQFSPGLRHVGGAALLPADGQRQAIPDVMQGIQHRQVAFAGDTESAGHAVDQQLVHEQPPAVALLQSRRLVAGVFLNAHGL
jgi:hypothetical protein